MNATWKTTAEQQTRQRRKKRVLLALVVVFLAGLWGYFFGGPAPIPGQVVELQAQESDKTETEQASPQQIPSPPALPDNIHKWTIASGDNLSAIFDSVQISQTVLFQILSADESLLALDILRPGNTLTFTLNEESRRLEEMELFIHPAHQVVYRRVAEDSFEYEEIILPGTWENQVINGEMDGSFYNSALLAGLSEQEAGNITYLFKSKINFARDIRAGDRFQVVRSLQSLDGRLTGQSHIEGIRIFTRKHSYTAFLFEDGNYYDEQGESLARAFQRYPYKGHHRISSPFNPSRRHPITGRISPHKGVDFSMPTGTPIYATGDGEVVRVKNHPFAGKYIEIKHDGRYVTRYLHLSKSTVRRGQKVKRGERIALSGNTGRSTGPHLHYELHIKGRAVNPMTAKIPMAASIPKTKFKNFQERVTEITGLMDRPVHHLVGS